MSSGLTDGNLAAEGTSPVYFFCVIVNNAATRQISTHNHSTHSLGDQCWYPVIDDMLNAYTSLCSTIFIALLVVQHRKEEFEPLKPQGELRKIGANFATIIVFLRVFIPETSRKIQRLEFRFLHSFLPTRFANTNHIFTFMQDNNTKNQHLPPTPRGQI